MTQTSAAPRGNLAALVGLFDSHTIKPSGIAGQKTQAVHFIPYLILHGGCLGVIWTGWSWTAVAVAIALYFVRMFAITGFYHRYFSHRTFETSRFWQFVFAVWGNSAAQKGPIWWAAQHRRHHRYSDGPEDAHSPEQHGFYWSHVGWLTCRNNLVLDRSAVPDLLKFPELVFLDRFDMVVPFVLGTVMYGLGALLSRVAPQLGTSGPQMLVWGFFISSVALFHMTCCINSLAHVLGRRRYSTTDTSRNNFALALLTMGEGWHNNHHHCPGATRQGFFWWEVDFTYYFLRLLGLLGIIRAIHEPPAAVLAAGRAQAAAQIATAPAGRVPQGAA